MPETRLTNAELIDYLQRAIIAMQQAEHCYHRGLWSESAEHRADADTAFQMVRAEIVARGL